jgi:hypothetical protein
MGKSVETVSEVLKSATEGKVNKLIAQGYQLQGGIHQEDTRLGKRWVATLVYAAQPQPAADNPATPTSCPESARVEWALQEIMKLRQELSDLRARVPG